VSESVFVTGGTGFLGGALIRKLVSLGRPVRALARSDDGLRRLRELGADSVRGDVLDLGTLRDAMRGCAVVYHAAGLNAFCLRDASPLFEANVEGSLNAVHAAADSGAGRIVYTSSAATLGEARGSRGTEVSPHRGSFLSNYERSKFEAECAVLATARSRGIELVSVNPASVQGPGRATGTARLLLDYLNGRLKYVVDSTFSLVDIADCTEGHLLAESRGEPGERYLLSGATLTVLEGVRLLERVAGIEGKVRSLPPALALGAATAVETVARLRRRNPRVCRELVRTALHGHAYDGSRAARELGLRYTPVEETLRRTVDWFMEQGLVRPQPPERTAS
jgi:dihydroflavonol-4-reductase